MQVEIFSAPLISAEIVFPPVFSNNILIELEWIKLFLKKSTDYRFYFIDNSVLLCTETIQSPFF